MNPQSKFQIPFSFFRQKIFDSEDLSSLLNIFPLAALLVDPIDYKIHGCNRQASECTAFTRRELCRMSLITLFPDLPFPFDPASASNLESNLTVRNAPTIQVFLSGTIFGSDQDWLILTFEPLKSLRQKQAEMSRYNDLLNSLAKLDGLSGQSDLRQSLEFILKIGSELSSSPMLAVYRGKGDTPSLSRFVSIDGPIPFPEELPVEELKLSDRPYLWMPGKRVISSLHRFARSNKLAYIASAPLGEPGAKVGLVVITAEETPPSERILVILRFLSGILTGTFQQYLLQDNISSELKADQKQLVVDKIIKDYAEDGVIQLSPDFKIVYMNPSAEDILGYVTEEVQNQPIDNILIGASSIKPALAATKEGITTPSLGNTFLHRRSGQSFPAQIKTIPIYHEDAPSGAIILIKDITEYEEDQIRIQQLEQRALLGEVSASFAHEVRNPINNLSMGLQLLAMEETTQPGTSDAIERMQQDCNRLTHLMDSVLLFARPTEYKIAPLDIGMVIQGLLNRWGPRLTRSKVKSQVQIDPDTPLVDGDSRALERVFTNLVNNAIEAMSQTGGVLGIKVSPHNPRPDREEIRIDVSDTGPGIPEEIRERIFEPFFTTKKTGTGLGLALTKQIIAAHKGNMQVTSIPGGTIFHVYLPKSTQVDAIESGHESS